jgi:hypothetical protein
VGLAQLTFVVRVSSQEILLLTGRAMSASFGFFGRVVQDPLASARLGHIFALCPGFQGLRAAIIGRSVDVEDLSQARRHQIRAMPGVYDKSRHAAWDRDGAIMGLLATSGSGICPGSRDQVRPFFMTASRVHANVVGRLLS